MNHPSLLDACFKKYVKNLIQWLPDGVTSVDLDLLHRLNLLHYYNKEQNDPTLTRYFHVVDSGDKITLVNEEFVIWIVPDKIEEKAVTYTLIAINKNDNLHLELAFVTSGIYNNSKLVLRILEKYLFEIQTTEDFLSKISS
ncbi:MAG: hypothetical protein H0X29_03655 [Parachlamydiaceae bacterium]|nr:hypothetical protein [Parachlamydiaceae bacterium]